MKSKYKKVTNEMIEGCVSDLEFYDVNGYFPWQNKIIIWFKRLRRKWKN